MSRVPFPPPFAPTHPPIASHRLSPPHRTLARDASSPRVRTPPQRVAHESSMIPAFASPSPSSSSTSSSPSRNARARTTRHERVHSDRARPTLTTRARIHSLRYIRARIIIIIIIIHPRERTPLTDHDSPPRDSSAIGGAADFARAIVISGRGCPIRRVTTRRGVPPTPAIDRADRSIAGNATRPSEDGVHVSPVMTRGTMCKQ